METIQSTTADVQAVSPTPPHKVPKRRIKKLTAAEVAGLPGANLVAEKKVEPDLAYFFWFLLPVSGLVGTTAEVGRVLDFAYRLNKCSTEKWGGEVTSVSISNGFAEVVLELNVTGEQESHGVPAANAFSQLKEYLDGEAILRSSPAGKPATWKANVNGTTIVVGQY